MFIFKNKFDNCESHYSKYVTEKCHIYFKEVHIQAFTNILNEVIYVVDTRAFGKLDISSLFLPGAPCMGLQMENWEPLLSLKFHEHQE